MARVIKPEEPTAAAVAAYERVLLEMLGPVPVSGDGEPGAGEGGSAFAQARADMERQIRDAYVEAARRGYEEGKAEFAKSVGQSAEALARASERIKQAHEAFLASAVPEMVRLAHAIAARVVRQEVRTDPQVIAATARAAVENLVEREHLVVHLNPQDLETLRQQGITLLDGVDGVRRLDVVPDETIEPGGLTVETDAVHVDARLDEQLQRLLDALME